MKAYFYISLILIASFSCKKSENSDDNAQTSLEDAANSNIDCTPPTFSSESLVSTSLSFSLEWIPGNCQYSELELVEFSDPEANTVIQRTPITEQTTLDLTLTNNQPRYFRLVSGTEYSSSTATLNSGVGLTYFSGQYEIENANLPRDVALTPDGNGFIVIGFVFGKATAFSERDWYVQKLDFSGNEIWINYFGTDDRDDPESIVILDSGEFYVIGRQDTDLSATDNFDVWLKKFDSDGSEILAGWNKSIDSGGAEAKGLSLKADENHLFALLRLEADLVLKKYDHAGTELDSETIDSGGSDRAGSKGLHMNGSFLYVAGEEDDGGDPRGFVRRYNKSDLSEAVGSQFPILLQTPSENDELSNMHFREDGSFLVIGRKGDSTELYIDSYDSAGNRRDGFPVINADYDQTSSFRFQERNDQLFLAFNSREHISASSQQDSLITRVDFDTGSIISFYDSFNSDGDENTKGIFFSPDGSFWYVGSHSTSSIPNFTGSASYITRILRLKEP